MSLDKPTPVYAFEVFGLSTYSKALAYHRDILRGLKQPLTKAMHFGSYFPEWFSLYTYMLYIEKHAATYFDKPHYSLLKLQWELHPFPNLAKLNAHLSYTLKHAAYPNPTGTEEVPEIDGYLIKVNNSDQFIVFDGIDDWEDVKEEATKLFRPYISLKAPTPPTPQHKNINVDR